MCTLSRCQLACLCSHACPPGRRVGGRGSRDVPALAGLRQNEAPWHKNRNPRDAIARAVFHVKHWRGIRQRDHATPSQGKEGPAPAGGVSRGKEIALSRHPSLMKDGRSPIRFVGGIFHVKHFASSERPAARPGPPRRSVRGASNDASLQGASDSPGAGQRRSGPQHSATKPYIAQQSFRLNGSRKTSCRKRCLQDAKRWDVLLLGTVGRRRSQLGTSETTREEAVKCFT